MRTFDLCAWDDVSNDELEKMVSLGMSQEKDILCNMLVHLNIMFQRNLYAQRGYGSLNDYLIKVFGMSKHQAFMRAQVARALTEHPGLLEMLRKGETHLSHLAIIANRLTPANSQVLYNAAATMTKSELEAFVPSVNNDGSIVDQEETLTITIRCSVLCAEMLAQVQALVANNKKNISHGDALQKALSEYLEKHHPTHKAERAAKRAEKKKQSLEEKARGKLEAGMDPSRGHPQAIDIHNREKREERDLSFQEEKTATSSSSQRSIQPLVRSKPASWGTASLLKMEGPKRVPISAAVKHRVMLRDQGQCTFRSEAGKRCEHRQNLQIDHVQMVCFGGKNHEANLRLLCSTHNRYEASVQLAESNGCQAMF